jgi:type I restriction enzyme S subunit
MSNDQPKVVQRAASDPPLEDSFGGSTVRNLSEIGRIVTGKTPPTSNRKYFDGEYMFVTPSDLHPGFIINSSARTVTLDGMKSVASNTLRGKSVLVGCIGWDMGNVAMTDADCVTNQQINSITDIDCDIATPEYLYYWLRLQKDYLFSIASGTRTPIVPKSNFEKIEVPLPDTTSQQRLTKILLALDKAIQINREISDKLAASLEMIYKYWFVQFDFPDQNRMPYRASGGSMKWDAELKREIPAGWQVGSIIDNPLSTPIKPGVNKFSEKIYLATADVKDTAIGKGALISFDNRENRANMQPRRQSVWFAKMKASRKHLFLSEAAESIIQSTILSTGFVGLACNNEESFCYLSALVADPRFETAKDSLAHGATQQAVNNTDLKSLKILLPSPQILKRFARIASPMIRQMNTITIENERLEELRDWLLPMLMNGQVTVDVDGKLSFNLEMKIQLP